MGAGVATVIISRAGSTIFEIASWSKPSIIIPIPEDVSHDQRSNAFAYASTGACSVIEEYNLAPHILMAEINRISENPAIAKKMSDSTTAFKHPDAAEKIAREIVNIALTHVSK
jgi:UDP-N-acetylglucosamine--N-acetylmuramyl-(pentapeptide) pyrophosphoryl-undecaprenol N-acetylglucosamine transferase